MTDIKVIESAMQQIAKGVIPHPPDHGLLIDAEDNVCCCGDNHDKDGGDR